MTCPLYFLHIAMFGKSSMDDVTSLCHKVVGKGEQNEKENADIYSLELDPHQ